MRSKRKPRAPRTQKQVNIIETIGLILLVLSAAPIAIIVKLSDSLKNFEAGCLFAISILLIAAAIKILLSTASDEEALDKEKLKKEMDAAPFIILPGGEKSRVLHAFREHGFQAYTNNIYKKTNGSYSYFRSPYYYYFAVMDAEDISSAYERFNELLMSAIPWTELTGLSPSLDFLVDLSVGLSFDLLYPDYHHTYHARSTPYLCPILFIYKEEITEDDLQILRALSTKAILTPAIREAYINTLPVLVDAHTGDCIYLEKFTRKCNGQDYSRCCKLLKKYLK